jgi:hypothetical protein
VGGLSMTVTQASTAEWLISLVAEEGLEPPTRGYDSEFTSSKEFAQLL